MIKKFIGTWLIQLFCVLWAAYLFLDYINYSEYFLSAFKNFKYTDLIITLIILTAGIVYLLIDKKKAGVVMEIRGFRGVYHYIFLLVFMAVIMLFYLNKTAVTPNSGSSAFAFIFRTIAFHAGLGLILLSAISSGIYFLGRLNISLDKTTLILTGLAIGLFLITLGLFVLGVFGLLYQFVVIPFIVILLIPGWKKSFSLIKEIVFQKLQPFKIHVLGILAYAFLILLVSIVLIFDTRTFPIGYDSIGLYMNVAKLIAGYNGLTLGGDAYNWSLLMSLGFIMYNNTTIAILISIVPGILCLFALYKICTNLEVNRSWSLFACVLFYSLPNTIWQSKNDEKTDLALLFITLCCLLLFTRKSVIESVKKKSTNSEKISRFSPEMTVWAISGILIGFTFGIKYIALLSIFSFLVVLFYTNAGKYAAITIFFLNFAVIFALDLTRLAAFQSDLMLLRFIVPFLLAIIAFIFAVRDNREGLLLAVKKGFVFCIAIGCSFLPWAVKNSVENKKLSIDTILTGKSPLPDLYSNSNTTTREKLNKRTGTNKINSASNINYAGFDFLTPLSQSSHVIAELSQEINSSPLPGKTETGNSTNNEKQEEIRRYIGYESGIIRFLSLPYDLAMKTNVRLVSSDSGILLLILIPVFIFVFSIRNLPWNIVKISCLLFLLIVSVLSVQFVKGSPDYNVISDSVYANSFKDAPLFSAVFLQPYLFIKGLIISSGKMLLPVYQSLTTQRLGVCFILLVVLSIPIYFLFRKSLQGLNMVSKCLVAFAFCIIQYWLILSSGIIWYGIVGFSLIPVVVVLLATKTNQNPDNNLFIKRFVIVCASIWFILILPYQFMPQNFLSTTDTSKIKYNEFVDAPFAKYAIGKNNESSVMKEFFSETQLNIIRTLNRDKNSKILNVSTFLNYFIVNNDKRIYKDNQLGIFNNLYSNARNEKSLLANEFKINNIRYVLVSLKTASIDNTPNKSLTKKFDNLMNAMVNNPKFRLLFTNRLVERPDGDMDINFNGSVIKAKYDIVGKRVIDAGSDALFEIL